MGWMGTLGSFRPSRSSPINHLYCLLFSPWSGRVRAMFRINHVAHLLGIKSIPINRVPKGALNLADQSQMFSVPCEPAGFGSASVNEAEESAGILSADEYSSSRDGSGPGARGVPGNSSYAPAG